MTTSNPETRGEHSTQPEAGDCKGCRIDVRRCNAHAVGECDVVWCEPITRFHYPEANFHGVLRGLAFTHLESGDKAASKVDTPEIGLD